MTNVVCLIPSIVGGGAEKVMSILVNELENRPEMHTTLICMEELKDEHYISPGISRYTLTKIKENDPPLLKALGFPLQVFRFITYVRIHRPHVIISFLERAILLTLISSFFFKAKIIISERNGITQNLSTRGFFARGILKFFYSYLYERANNITVVSKTIKDDLVNDYGISAAKITVIYNPYELEKIDFLKNEKVPEEHANFFKEGRVLINVGRYYPVKNQVHLIEVFAELRRDFPDIKLCIIGKGPLEKEILVALDKHKITECTLLPGFQKNPYCYLYNSSIYVMTSLFEGFPNALVEAMLCNLPVVAYDCKSGPQEILDDKYGLVIPLNDGQRLKQALSMLLKDKSKYEHYQVVGSERARQFSVETFMSRFLALINS